MHVVFYFTTHRSFVFYYTTLSRFCILVLRWMCHTVLKVFWRLVCCVIVHEKFDIYSTTHSNNSFYFTAPLSIKTFIMPHNSYDIEIYFTTRIPKMYFILPRCAQFKLLLCHTPTMSTFILKQRHLKNILFYHALIFFILKSCTEG